VAQATDAYPANRIVGLSLVLLLHVGLVYLLVSGVALRHVEVRQTPIEARIIAAPAEERVTPPPPSPAFEPPRPPFVPPPEVNIESPPPPQSTAITNVTPVPPPVAAPAPPVPAILAPRIDMAASHEPEYPPVSRRLGEQGTVILSVLVDPSGRAVEARVVSSSGFSRLDQAAIDGVKSNYRFTPGTVDGKPQAMWYTFKFTWKLEG
jgi:periplasmic protein TonB